MINTTTCLAHITRLLVGWIILILSNTHLLSAQNADQLHPNVIFILVDDLGYGDVNFNLPEGEEFRNPYVRTPNLAKLAGESLVLRHHYAASPVCSPSRAGLLTGRTPTRHNINLYIRDNRDDDLIFLPG